MPCLCCLQALKGGYDSVIVDTAGRLQIDDRLMGELQATKAAIKPTDTLLVVDAMTGQEAASLVKAFNDAVELTGGVLLPRESSKQHGVLVAAEQCAAARHLQAHPCRGRVLLRPRQIASVASQPHQGNQLLQGTARGSPLTRTSVALQVPS